MPFYVEEILDGGPAANSGAKVGDLLTVVNGRGVRYAKADDLEELTASLPPNQSREFVLQQPDPSESSGAKCTILRGSEFGVSLQVRILRGKNCTRC